MRINHNIAALNTYRQLNSAGNSQSKSMEKLSSGLRINRAGDDAAGLAISEKMRGQIRGLDQASKNSQDGISMIQTAEGALNETHDILQRMRELAVQSSNDTNTDSDRKELQKEVNQLTQEIDRIANTTEFNTQKLLDGSKVGLKDKVDGSVTLQNNSNATITAVASDSDALAKSGTITITRTTEAASDDTAFSISNPNGLGTIALAADLSSISSTDFGAATIDLTGLANMKSGESITLSIGKMEAAETDVSEAFSFQIGANSGQNMLVGINSMKADDLGVTDGSGNGIDITSAEKATAAITSINTAIEKVSGERSKLGASQNRLEHTINNLNTSSENLTAAESRVRDVDMAKEMMNQTKNSILSQAAQAMLAQSNQMPQGVLQLLR
ncbi:flagellin N-terminal helical domain-containing protein [Rossellomorea yichunensis]|jgi:flagellin|uniref:flagellin N-terminal helical domain-containing protein n=1 Tax=Rossellomorea yichunensis TaxID=3077331 RepID=UPI0028DF04E7|nr:flagellin [Rossellomorea sp. YC4-1]MDT9026461.1 flagellin [Rossellomorea sp. YC4-1]